MDQDVLVRIRRARRRRQRAAAALLSFQQTIVEGRLANRARPPLDFSAHADFLTEAEFARLFRLDKLTFAWLLDGLRPLLPAGPDALPVNVQLSACLRFLAGGSYLDICWSHGIARATLYAVVERVLPALDRIDALNLRFPINDLSWLATKARGFQARFDNPLYGCVGALDGLAVRIVRPSVPNSQAYFNRKGFFAIVLQAMCDADYRFTYASCRAAGSTHDSLAFSMSDLANSLEQRCLPEPFWIAADEAYPCSNSILTPWSGRELPTDKDAFNFWLSSSRIHIEQAFGQLVARWGLLWRDIKLDIAKVPSVVMVILKLHNLCVSRNVSVPSMRRADLLDGDGSVHLQDHCDTDMALHRRRRDAEVSQRRRLFTQQLALNGIMRPVRPGSTRGDLG